MQVIVFLFLAELLPNQLLAPEHSPEPVVMTTADQEQYLCVLPSLEQSEDGEVRERVHEGECEGGREGEGG